MGLLDDELKAATAAAKARQDGTSAVTARSIANIRVALMTMTSEERIFAFEQLAAGYCVHCGESIGESICYCRNDE